jgi:hypothetical protein
MAPLLPAVGMDEDLGEVVATLYLDALNIVVDQEEKPDLWAEPETTHEELLQNELRDLHNALEREEHEQTGDIALDHYAAALEVLTDQAEDDSLWGPARTTREACLKKELRLLHAVLEADWDMVEALEFLEESGGLKPTVLH